MAMRTAIVSLESTSPFSTSKYHGTPKLDGENPVDYEQRTWRERIHYDVDDNVIIPSIMFKNAISEAAKFMSIPIPGNARAKYTKHFEAGVLCTDGITLDIKKNDVSAERLFVPSDGRRGGTTRVEKTFPYIPRWSGEVTFFIVDDVITESVFEKVVVGAGQFIGVGRWRPKNNGIYGRFKLNSIEWA